MKLKTVKTEQVTDNFFDQESGELINTSKHTKTHRIILDDKDEFVFMYMSVLSLIDDLDNVCVKVLCHCCRLSTKGTNMVALTKPFIEDISDRTKLKEQTIRNAIVRLVKKNALIKLGAATYRINPRYYWKGNSTERLKTMEYILRVECPNC